MGLLRMLLCVVTHNMQDSCRPFQSYRVDFIAHFMGPSRFKARPKDISEQYESELRETKEALGEAHLQIYALKSGAACSTRTRTRKVAAGGNGRGRSCSIAR